MQIASNPCRILVAGTTGEEIVNLLPFARILATSRQDELIILGLVPVAEDESLSRGTSAAQQLRRQLESLAHAASAHLIVRVTHHPWREARAAVGGEECSLLLVNWSSALPEDVLRALPCDVIIVKGALSERIERILLPIRGGPYAAQSLQVARAFAQAHGAQITLMHAASPARFRDEGFREFFGHLQAIPEITRWLKVRGDAVPAILAQADPNEHQLLIIGAIARPQPEGPPVGPTATRLVDAVNIPTLIVKTKQEFPETGQAEAAAPPIDYTISVVVDKWFAENTFAAHEFDDLKWLVESKEKQGLKISLGLPTLNEEATIGRVIKTVRRAFMQRYPLLDEVVVIDSNSTDRTVEIASDLGVPVFKHPEILAQYGSFAGKGEALWNSLYVLQGDLIAWIDTDIVNIHPRFVYGILGPLIREPHLMYVKGFYQRPLRIGRKLQAHGGGRVTELVARPLLNLFYPELSGILQPLSGEYAGRREALEKVPFFTGYGVEIGLLIDILRCCGLAAIGQVDLEERVHRNQTLFGLSKMAFAIIQVVLARVEASRQVEILNALNASLKLIKHEGQDYHVEVFDIRDHERPPMVTIPEYCARRGLEPRDSR